MALQLELDPKSLRAAGVSRDEAERAVSGQDLDPATIARLASLLAPDANPASTSS